MDPEKQKQSSKSALLGLGWLGRRGPGPTAAELRYVITNAWAGIPAARFSLRGLGSDRRRNAGLGVVLTHSREIVEKLLETIDSPNRLRHPPSVLCLLRAFRSTAHSYASSFPYPCGHHSCRYAYLPTWHVRCASCGALYDGQLRCEV